MSYVRNILLSLAFTVPLPAQGLPPQPANAYQTHCASCHGGDLHGAAGPSILGFVQYHADAELTERLRIGNAHRNLHLSDADLRQVLSESRILAGTNRDMATGGFTGLRKFVWGKSGRAEPTPEGKNAFLKVCTQCHTTQIVTEHGETEEGWKRLVINMVERGARGSDAELTAIVNYLSANFPPKLTAAEAPNGEKVSGGIATFDSFNRRQETLKLKSGGTLQGILLSQTRSDAQLVTAAGKIHLLARDGDQYRDKPIEPKSDWLSYHGDWAGARYSRLETINTTNAHQLTVAWKFVIPTSPRLQATPIVADGVMYMTGWNELYALDATTGHQIWSYHEPHTEGLLSEAGQGSNRGVAVSGNRLFFMLDDARLLAFDRKTGAKLWEAKRGAIAEGLSATPAPLVVGDLVLVGVSGGEEGLRGFIDAYNIETGKRAWRFYTIPKRGEKGSETWAGQALEHGCGATWMTGSYDPTLDLVYWGTGNPCPDYNGAERKGDNLYTASVVALAAKTGELKWHFQFTPHDTHDWDSAQSMILVDENWGGRSRKLLLHGDRNGYFFVLDRSSGELLLAEPLSTKVTWTTGYGKDGRPILTSTSEASPEGTALCPSAGGGPNWPDPSYNPITKLFYVRVADSCGIFTSGDDPLGVDNRWTASGKPTEKARESLAKLTEDYPGGTFIRAMNIATGKKVWDYPTQERTGVLSTAGQLVFVGGKGGLTALDAKTGKEIVTVDSNQPPTALPVFAASPMTYMVGGKQYVVLSGMGNVTAYALPDE